MIYEKFINKLHAKMEPNELLIMDMQRKYNDINEFTKQHRTKDQFESTLTSQQYF